VPPHEGIELGIGDASVIRALAEVYGRKEEHVKKDLRVVKLLTCLFSVQLLWNWRHKLSW
jgi:hypothetical protein